PHVAANPNGNAYFTWIQNISGVDQVCFGRIVTGLLVTTVVLSSGTSAHVRIASGGVNAVTGATYVYLAYISGSAASVQFLGSSPNGSSFASTTAFTTGNPIFELALAANKSGVIHVVWTETGTNPAYVISGQRNTNFGLGGSWLSSPVRVSHPPG